MLITVTNNREANLLTNIRATLSQIKDATKANLPLVLQHSLIGGGGGIGFSTLDDATYVALTDAQYVALSSVSGGAVGCTISFYVDQAKSILLFTEDSVTNPSSFATNLSRTIYTPPDAKINASTGISTTAAQELYYVTATFGDGIVINTTYRNADNLLFASVIVATKPNPQFSTNDNSCVIVCGEPQLRESKDSDDRGYVIVPYDLYLQLNVFDWSNLSEENRTLVRIKAENLIRLALYQDRYRNHNAALYSPDIQGTGIGRIKPLESKAVLQACIKVQCAYMTESQNY
jgi:hypothetical protein